MTRIEESCELMSVLHGQPQGRRLRRFYRTEMKGGAEGKTIISRKIQVHS
jgi:hypothetical protein